MRGRSAVLAGILTFALAGSTATIDDWPGGRWSHDAARELYGLLDTEHFARCGNHLEFNLGRLRAIARWKAADMALHNDLDHTDAAGKRTFELFRAAGGGYQTYGEILGVNTFSLAETVPSIFAGWMDSPGHRAVVISCTWTRVGIGAFRAEAKKWYAVEYIKP